MLGFHLTEMHTGLQFLIDVVSSNITEIECSGFYSISSNINELGSVMFLIQKIPTVHLNNTGFIFISYVYVVCLSKS